VLYQWTPGTSGTATLQTCGTSTRYDSVVYVRGDSCTGTVLACNDDTAGCGTGEPNDHHGSFVTLAVTAGRTYVIVVDGYNGAAGAYALTVTAPAGAAPTSTAGTSPGPTPTQGTTAIASRTPTPIRTVTPTRTATPARTATPVPTPTVGACTAAVDMPSTGGTFNGTTSGTSTLAATCASSNTSPEQVYRWTPTRSGTATIETCGTATLFDTIVSLRQPSCDSGPERACNDDTTGCGTGEPNDHHGSRIRPRVTAGVTYFIVVDGYGGARGDYRLRVTPP
jgi:hypothetical protein